MRRSIVLILAALLLGIVPMTAARAAAPNENFASATNVSPFPFADTVDTTTAGGLGDGRAAPSCRGTHGVAHTVWYKYAPAQDTAIKVNTFQSSYNTIMALYELSGAASFANLTELACNDNVTPLIVASRVTINAKAGKTYYIQVGGLGSLSPGGTLKFRVKLRTFNAAVVRGSTWYLNDGHDLGANFTFNYGLPWDRKLAGDWVGNGASLPWVRRGSAWSPNDWFDSEPARTFGFGSASDFPVLGDWNGNRVVTVGVVRGNLWLLDDNNDGISEHVFNWGSASDRKLVGDWDGNNTYTPGLARGSTWYFNNGFDTTGEITLVWGSASDTKIVGDWDGNGTFTPGLVRGNLWLLNNGFDTTAEYVFHYGASTDFKIVGDWDGTVE